MSGLGSKEHKQEWFKACLYILNKHWDKVDNFRIDKFLALLRHMFSQCMTFLKENDYSQDLVEWFQALLNKVFNDSISAQGISLHIADIFVPELGKIDQDGISLEQIAKLIQPFLTALAKSGQAILRERIVERIFEPLLESNVTLPDSDEESEESEEENLALVDGGKLSKSSKKRVQAIIDEKYVFPAFNILIYAENYIFAQASVPSLKDSPEEGISEGNREILYKLYDMARKLEPEPRFPPPTFSQRQLMNRARKFITMRMKKRQELRT